MCNKFNVPGSVAFLKQFCQRVKAKDFFLNFVFASFAASNEFIMFGNESIQL